MAQYRVAERFTSINGEGTLAGQLAVFIRFQGCNLNCSYCDTAWANQEDTVCTIMTEQQIYGYIKESGIQNVTLTGGEPLLQPDIMDLLLLLSNDRKLHVEIETNGSIDLSEFVRMSNPPAFTMDYKLPGSLMEAEMLLSNFGMLTGKDTVKFVAGSIEDLECAKKMMGEHELLKSCRVFISTVFGKIGLEEVVDFMMKNKMNGVTLQLQLHKVIWEPDKKGV